MKCCNHTYTGVKVTHKWEKYYMSFARVKFTFPLETSAITAITKMGLLLCVLLATIIFWLQHSIEVPKT